MAPSGSTSEEVDRLRRVYRLYDADPTTRARWQSANPGNAWIERERGEQTRALLAAEVRRTGSGGRVLELGCGTGQALAGVAGVAPPNGVTVGVDLSERRLGLAAERLPAVPFVCGEGSMLPFGPGTFDVVLAFTVFSSILDDDHARHIASEVRRVLRGGGAVLWYDMRWPNPANRHTRAWRRRAVKALFPGCAAELDPLTVLPLLARRLGMLTDRSYPVLARVPALTTHHLGVIRMPG